MGLFSGPVATSQSNASSLSGLDKEALPQWHNLFAGYQQGVAPWQQAGFDQAMKSALSKFSGLAAARGGMTPFSLPQIASSAAQYTLPQFAMANSQALNELLSQRQIATSKSNAFSREQGSNLFGKALAGSLQNALSPGTYLNAGKGGGGMF